MAAADDDDPGFKNRKKQVVWIEPGKKKPLRQWPLTSHPQENTNRWDRAWCSWTRSTKLNPEFSSGFILPIHWTPRIWECRLHLCRRLKSEKSASAVGASHHSGPSRCRCTFATTTHFTFRRRRSAWKWEKQDISEELSAERKICERFWISKQLVLCNCFKCVTVKVTLSCYLPFQTFLWDAHCKNLKLSQNCANLRLSAF